MKPNYKRRLLLFITGGVHGWVSDRGNNRLGVVRRQSLNRQKIFPKEVQETMNHLPIQRQ